MQQYYFIINPLASSGKAAFVWRDCKAYMDRHQIEYKAYMTSYAGHGIELAAALTGSSERLKEKTIIVIGGDGTFGDVVSGINISSKVSLAFIPGGSGNDFAKSTHLSGWPVRRLKHILKRPREMWLDYGIISYIQGELQQRRFIVSGGLGLDARICECVHVSPLKGFLNRLHLGRFVYIGVGLKQIFVEKPLSVQICVDKGRILEYDRVRYISIQVQPREGGGFKMAPQASAEDGMFDLCIVDCKNRFYLFRVLVAALFGRHTKMRGVSIVRCSEAAFRMDQKVCVHTDGEICGHLDEFSVVCEKRKLKMIL